MLLEKNTNFVVTDIDLTVCPANFAGEDRFQVTQDPKFRYLLQFAQV